MGSSVLRLLFGESIYKIGAIIHGSAVGKINQIITVLHWAKSKV